MFGDGVLPQQQRENLSTLFVQSVLGGLTMVICILDIWKQSISQLMGI